VTRAAPFTQAGVRRAIAAALKEGLTVIGIRADGTVLVQNGDKPLAPCSEAAPTVEPSKWNDVEV